MPAPLKKPDGSMIVPRRRRPKEEVEAEKARKAKAKKPDPAPEPDSWKAWGFRQERQTAPKDLELSEKIGAEHPHSREQIADELREVTARVARDLVARFYDAARSGAIQGPPGTVRRLMDEALAVQSLGRELDLATEGAIVRRTVPSAWIYLAENAR